MKKALIIHGWDGSPDEPLHKYLKQELENLGYEVVVPLMPSPKIPVIKDWISKIDSVFDENFDLVVGHSVGCQAILRFLDSSNLGRKVSMAILIAPWMELDKNTLIEEGEKIAEIARPWMETPIDFSNVGEKIENMVVIFSDNDPYVSLGQVKFFEENLKAKTIVESNQGHFTESDGFESLQTDIGSILQ